MRKGLLLTAAAAGLLGAATASQAGVIVEIENLGDPTTTASGGITAPGFQAYLVRLVTTQPGELIQAVDFGGSAGSPNGLTGQFLQRASINDETQERSNTPQSVIRNNSNSSASLDSHFLPPANVRADVAAPAENNDLVNPPGSPADTAANDYGTGTLMTATFGILGASQGSSLDLAYIVQDDTIVNRIVGSVNTSLGTFAVDSPIPVPEPASLGLLALGGLGLLARRRR